MVKLLVGVLLLFTVSGFAVDAGTEDGKADWVVWMDGIRYVPEWSIALQSVWNSMKPGERGLLQTRSAAHPFVRNEDPAQLEDLVASLRPELEREAQTLDQLGAELVRYSGDISTLMDQGSIRNFINVRKQLLERYAVAHKRFWAALAEGWIAPRARLVVLVQQFDVPAVSRQTLSSMMESNQREWVLELQDSSPWEERGKSVKQIASQLNQDEIRVDGFYIKNRSRSVRGGTEVSKAFFSGVTRLCKSSGGSSQNLKSRPDENEASLSR